MPPRLLCAPEEAADRAEKKATIPAAVIYLCQTVEQVKTERRRQTEMAIKMSEHLTDTARSNLVQVEARDLTSVNITPYHLRPHIQIPQGWSRGLIFTIDGKDMKAPTIPNLRPILSDKYPNSSMPIMVPANMREDKTVLCDATAVP